MQGAEVPLISVNENENKPHEEDYSQFSGFKNWTIQAWRFTVASGALAGFLILLTNIITLAVMYGKFRVIDYTITFFTGSCDTASTVTIASHVVINILSTILLAASNFSMQCLSSPTRKEVDAAHARKHWLSIGTPTIRNLYFVSKQKALLWLILAISSFPLHMFWNSTVFQTRMTNNYLAVTITEDFLHGGSWEIPSGAPDLSFQDYTIEGAENVPQYHSIIQGLQQKATSRNSENSTSELEFLTVEQCIKAYGQDQLSNRQHVLLVVDSNATSSVNTDSSLLAIYYNTYTVAEDTHFLFLWMCQALSVGDLINGGEWSCPSELLKNNVDNWIPGNSGANGAVMGSQQNAPVRHCYSQKAPEQCKANLVPTFLIVVIICNVIKLACFGCALLISKKDQPLCTTGDAIQSFLQQPDPHTQGRCLVAKYEYEKLGYRLREWVPRLSTVGDLWNGGSWRWAKAVGWYQWLFYLLSVAVVIIIAGFKYDPLGMGQGSASLDPAIVSLGLGKPHQSFTVTDSGVANILTGFLTANTPQIIVSYVYLGLNNILTTILVMVEWCSYTAGPKTQAKGLRVSSPVAGTEQRSTYTLSVPLKWAIPVSICIAVLHWAVSETLFLAQIDVYDVNTRQIDLGTSVTDVFYSLLPKYITVAIGSALVITLVCIGMFASYPGTMPLAGCCSASIAAACQPSRPRGDGVPGRFPEDLAYKKLQWGVLETCEEDLGSGIGHATFGTEVSPLVEGKLYA